MDAERMQVLVSATQGRIKRAWYAAVRHLRDENTVDALTAQARYGGVTLAGLDRAAAGFAAAELGAYVAAGQATASWLGTQMHQPPRRHAAERDPPGIPSVRKAFPVFDAADTGATRWAAQNKLDRIREVTDDQRSAIREALTEGSRAGANPRDTAQRIYDSIGLTSYQEQVVANYRRELQAGQYAAALERELSSGHSDKTIAAALRARTTMTQAQIDKAVERYRDNWIQWRAENIARTEGLRVAHQSSEELYRQAVEHGDIEADQIQRTWNHSPGAKNKKNERWFHVVMHGQTVGFGEPFTSGLGTELMHPGDPKAGAEETCSCRCCLSTRILPSRGAAAQGQGGGSSSNGDGDPAAAQDEELPDEAPADDESADDEEDSATDADEATDEPADEGESESESEDDVGGEPGDDPLADDLTTALLTFDYAAATEAIDAAAVGRGFEPLPTANRLTTEATPGANGYRGWDGVIVLAPSYAAGAFDFAEAWQVAVDREGLIGQSALELAQQVPARGDGVLAMVHEHLHGFGPVRRELYVGYGVPAEEVATEVTARAMMRDHFGMAYDLIHGRAYGAYGDEITATLEAIREVYGSTPGEAWDVLTEASAAYKRVGAGATDLETELLDAVNQAARGGISERGRLRHAFESRL